MVIALLYDFNTINCSLRVGVSPFRCHCIVELRDPVKNPEERVGAFTAAGDATLAVTITEFTEAWTKGAGINVISFEP
eukprot:2025151-Karenia_brevis.AAC.1